MTQLLFAATVFTSAFLLFLVQPMVSKHILPWFGGSAAVWATCLVFFQSTLLAGYAYADWTTRRLRARQQAWLHIVLLVLAAATLSVLAGPGWKPAGDEDPSGRILLLLAATIGLPYFMLSTTGPLVQSWVARSLRDTNVYRYFSLSNLASLVGLMAYPFVIEPRAALATQAAAWSGVFFVFAGLCAASAFSFQRLAGQGLATPGSQGLPGPAQDAARADAAPSLGRQALWLLLSATGSWLLLAITNHITQNIAAIPFLWLLPLVLYLLSFVLCFESDRWYRRAWLLPPTAVVLALCAHGLSEGALGFDLWVAIPLYVGGLFLLCMFAHGELARLRPAPRHLTRFYLMLSAGGALGGIAVALVAPRVLPAYYELGIGFVAIAALAAVVLAPQRWLAGLAVALALWCAWSLTVQVRSDHDGARLLMRSFYGTLMTLDTTDERPEDRVRQLYHGAVKHGEQYLLPARRREPTAYYGPSSGVGLSILSERRPAQRVGLIGVGAGTLAVYGQPGDVYRFYEISPQVIELARTEFSFLADSQARIDMVLGDARLSLEREPPQQFDVLAVDAFSGDSVPVHLITREAMAVYLRHLAPDGIVAFHVTNQFLSLAPVVQRIAAAHGLHAVLIHDEARDSDLRRTDWVLVARDPARLQQAAFRPGTKPIPEIPGLATWTDDFNNLFEVLKR